MLAREGMGACQELQVAACSPGAPPNPMLAVAAGFISAVQLLEVAGRQ